MSKPNDPKWWSPEHESTWDRVKSALKRDWEQTKADLSTAGHELNQSAGDTVKQAAGKEVIPPGNVPNAKAHDWDHVEQPYRYGVGARQQYGAEHASWDQRLETKLAADWTDLKNGRTWEEVKTSVRHAWDHKNV